MRPTASRISLLATVAARRLGRLDEIAANLKLPLTPESRRALSYISIEGANLWTEYSRCLYFSAAFGARDSTGEPTVPDSPMSEAQALTMAVHAVRPELRESNGPWRRKHFPDWNNKGHLRLTLEYVGATILDAVEAALGLQTRVLGDIHPMRNFFAHKSQSAFRIAADLAPRYGFTSPMKPDELLCSVPPIYGGPNILISEWLADMHDVLNLMP